VLDDEAVDCPFCGAPMKGGSAPARPAPAARGPATKASSDKSAPSRGGTGSAAAVKSPSVAARSETSTDEATARTTEDDPFGIDPAVAANAIPVSRQSGAGKTIEVVCPMCETKGYVSPKASGKQVKCCNAQCMVPLFMAPVLEKKVAVAPPPPPKKKIPWLYVGGGIVVASIVVVCVYFIQDHGPQGFDAPDDLKNYQARSEADQVATPDKGNIPTSPGAAKVEAVQTPEVARDAVIKQALAHIMGVASNIDKHRQPAWRRLTASAYIYANDPTKAREQLNLLEKSSSSWEGIPPLVSLAWRNANSPAEFKKTIAEAAKLTEKLPSRGRYATEAAIAVAPLQIVSGNMEAAGQLLGNHHNEPPLEQFAAATRLVIEDNSFNFDRTLTGRALGDWQYPLETAVTLVLAAHGRWDDAHGWASQISDPVAKTEATIAWAESLLRDTVPIDDASGLARAVAAGKDFSAEGRARLLARLADVRFSQGDNPGAAELLNQAQEALKSLPPANPVIVEGIKPLLDLKLEDATKLKQMALAAAGVARVQAQTGDARAWDNVLLSLRFLSAIGPAISPTQERRRQVDGDSNRVKEELARALAIKKEDEKRRALTQYKLKLSDVEAAATTRFQGEVVVLKAAANAGLHDNVWRLLETYDRRPQKENQVIATFLSPLVAQRFAEAGDREKSDEITAAVESRIDPADPEVVKLLAERDFMSGNLTGCVNQLKITPHGHLHETVLRLACRLVVGGKISDAISFCNRIRDLSLREEGLYFTAALAARSGKGVEFWKLAKDQNLGAMETCAAAAGMIVGFNTEAAK
jgi:hypothetical protein